MIEPSPCNAGIMVRLLGLSAPPCCVERICLQRKRGPLAAFIYFSWLSESLLLWHSKYACGEWETATEVRIWMEWTGP